MIDRPLLSLATVSLIVASARAQDDASAAEARGPWPSPVAAALERAGDNRSEIIAALERAPAGQRAGVAFLVEHMPERDLRSLSAEFLLENTALAYEVRAKVPWGDAIPDPIFLNDVLPYAHVSERREGWRRDFVERFLPAVAECKTPSQAAQRLNETVFSQLGVGYSTQRARADQSPSQSIESGIASCTGLSILLADACRAVAVPARLAGIPRWVNKRGNHTWVEIWDGDWHFTGACEPDARGLDHAWFERDAALAQKGSRWHAIYAVSYERTGTEFPMVWARGADPVSAVDVSDRYAAPAAAGDPLRLMLRVLDGPAGRRVAASVTVVDAEDPARTFEGQAKDERADTNDFLTFDVERGHIYEIRARLGAREASLRHRVADADQEVVDIVLAAESTSDRELTPDDVEALRAAVTEFFAADAERRSAWRFSDALDGLLLAHEPQVRAVAWEAFKSSSMHRELRADHAANRVRAGGYESPFVLETVGERPEGGWPLFIAMHGGGGVPKRVNDQQWRHMQVYYRDQDSVPGYLYLALRAPTDAWNGFYTDYVYPLIARLIRQCLVCADVNPDKVFLIGYSHGGYGAFAIGPKMPDRFAAIHASAAAPTDGQTSAKTLRNTVFTFMIGENDRAYGRIDRCRRFAAEIAELRGDRDDIYPVTMELKEGFGHGGLPDRDKIRDMYPAVRDATPRELTWELTDSVIRDFFWLSVDEPAPGCSVDAVCRDGLIELRTEKLPAVSLELDARLIDYDRPLSIRAAGATRTVQPRPSLAQLCRSLDRRGDPRLATTVRIEVRTER